MKSSRRVKLLSTLNRCTRGNSDTHVLPIAPPVRRIEGTRSDPSPSVECQGLAIIGCAYSERDESRCGYLSRPDVLQTHPVRLIPVRGVDLASREKAPNDTRLFQMLDDDFRPSDWVHATCI